MSTTDVDFPRHEFTLAKGPQYLALFGGGAVLAYLILKGLEAIAPSGPWSASGGRIISGAVLLTICLVMGLKLFSRIDFSKVMLTIDREGVHVVRPQRTATADRAAASIPWSSISKIKYYAIGRLQETKIIVIEMREVHQREVRIEASLFSCGSPRELYETMKRYHRQFAPVSESDDAADGRVYQSASWTGLDDD
jgi:hypothetical protein